MATGLLLLLDDIAALMDDVAVMTKVAAKKTAGVLGDDLALNAQQVAGVQADRELPVVWAVAKGSMLNKAILVPAALAISVWLPWLITPLLMLGGAYLCFEGVEKLVHAWHARQALKGHDEPGAHTAAQAAADIVEVGQAETDAAKIKGAIRTDFILSAEIIVIALGTLATATLAQKVGTLVGVAIVMTVGVYGLVAGIVKLDDAGLALLRSPGRAAQALGRGLLAFAPKLMKTLSVAGTAAMFLVGGGILVHGVPSLHHAVEHVASMLSAVPGGALVASSLADALVGMAAGALVLGAVMAVRRLRGGTAAKH
jgi:uncharacterized protein